MTAPALGSALPMNARKELFSYAFITAIAASAQCELVFFKMDYNSVDAQIISTADDCPQIGVQVKATASDCIQDGMLVFDLPIKNYHDLRRPRLVPNMLVVLHLPSIESQWLKHGTDSLSLHNAAYYLNVAALGESDNAETQRIKIPTSQELRRETLQNLLQHVSKHKALP